MAFPVNHKFQHLFPEHIRARGRSLFWGRAVSIEFGNEREVHAFVRGSQKYNVELKFEDGDLLLFCSCLDFQGRGPCKHLWATILATDGTSYLSAVGKVANLDIGPSLILEAMPPAAEQILAPPKPPLWKSRLTSVDGRNLLFPLDWPEKREAVYVVDMAASTAAASLVLALYTRDRKLNGSYSKMLPLALKRGQIPFIPHMADREVLSLVGGGVNRAYGNLDAEYNDLPQLVTVRHPLARHVLPLAIQTGRCFVRTNSASEMVPLLWEEAEPWRFELAIEKDRSGNALLVTGKLRRGTEEIEVTEAGLVTQDFVFRQDKVAPLADDARVEWLHHMRRQGSINAPVEDSHELLATLLGMASVPPLRVPEDLRFEEVTVAPRPAIWIQVDRFSRDGRLLGQLSFDYDGRTVPAQSEGRGVYDAVNRRLLLRDEAAEHTAAELLTEAGAKYKAPNYTGAKPEWEFTAAKLPRGVRTLLDAGWRVDVAGQVFRRPGTSQLEVTSGVDWFELHGSVQFEGVSAKLPQLLEALRRGESTVLLDDGSYGILPEEWLRKIGMLAGMGEESGDHFRFRRTQTGLLDALLAAQPEISYDEKFAQIRAELKQFDRVESSRQPDGFVGVLRDYQREGLGWMDFLRRYSFGGCLADDMGVGKTAQVLAMLETRREQNLGPSLVVVPRSLIFNWKQEAERFTPQLRVHDYSGAGRESGDFAEYNLVLTTYGTLRKDILHLKSIAFDYVVLDEAQAVKNSSSESAKAVRLLRANHRLAMSGTPVENHLGELWSLFEFLNPGMLGSASVFKNTGGAARNADEDTRRLLRQALRPFILRRTKDQVARELPAKTEQTLICELDPPQRKLYNELRQHYRDNLLQKVRHQGLAKSKIMVLEALLRLRQAACHPGLIDAERSGEPSAKLDALLEQLSEVLESGHKALVFSQFTSFLKIVRSRLDKEGIVYEYLDGKTKDRQAPVERFQNDPACNLFLISLKAGGLGLNLTAAEYVFLLDPWWNPAVEAQAVDRAHRIGQLKAVFAYRLIARDTVEEKVLELQKSKKDLAAAIIGEDNALIRDLRPEDLELLLS